MNPYESPSTAQIPSRGSDSPTERPIVYEFQFTTAYLLDSVEHYEKSKTKSHRLAWNIAKVLLALWLILAIGYVSLVLKLRLFAIVMTIVSIGWGIAPYLRRRRMVHDFQKSPLRDEWYRIELSADGVRTIGRISHLHQTWSAFPSVRRFDDGYLLFQNPRLFNWLPTNALRSGGLDELDPLLQREIADYARIELGA